MNVNEIAVGQRSMWYLLEKLGEGDAGEVYRVESTLEGKQAILKRPRREAFSSDALRQAAQIRSEGAILRALEAIAFPDSDIQIKTPAWLDQSKPDEALGERFFIIIERARGFDLKTLRQIAHSGTVAGTNLPAGDESSFFVETLAQLGHVPELLLVRSLLGTLHLLETIHFREVWNEDTPHSGILWNDVKPEHLYWDPARAALTVIDWGNSQYLEVDGATRDRRYSSASDDAQFIREMGSFLAEACPALHARLKWPADVPLSSAAQAIKPLRQSLRLVQEGLTDRLKVLRGKEADLNGTTRPKSGQLRQSEELRRRIVSFGELPDSNGAVNLHARLLLQLASEGDLEAFRQGCERAASLAGAASEKWQVLGEIASLASGAKQATGNSAEHSFASALAAGVADDWPGLLWELAAMLGDGPLPPWWESVSQSVRQVYLRLGPETLPPSVEVSRIFYTLQATVLQMGDQQLRANAGGECPPPERVQAYESLLKILDEEVVKKWKEVEPTPPNSGIAYQEFNGLLGDIEAACPGASDKIEKALAQPRAQAEIVLDAWEHKEFELARRGLRMLHLWDPERRRLLQADRALVAAPQWLAQIYQGAGADEPFYDYITTVELAGRRLRSQIGPASWLDTILDALKRLRKGSKHADLIMEHPQVLNEIPWLNEYRSREILSLPREKPLRLERSRPAAAAISLISGIVETRLSPDKDVRLVEPLDTWMPEARGSSARVFAGDLMSQTGKLTPCAVKVMRPDRLEYATPLFREEAQILTLLRDVPGVSPLVECGYLRLKDARDFPSDEGHSPVNALRGEVVRFGVEETQNYLASMERYMAQGWLPYLALVKRDQDHNLMKYCDAGYTHGWFLPLRESLLLVIQICDILQVAHDRNIVYRDHKILHYYWDPGTNGVVMIDWNIAKRQPQGLSEAERQFDLAQFGARAFHHILTGRPAAGALPLGPNRPEEIEGSALRYPVSWTFDDERLPNRVKEIIEQLLNQGYTDIRDLRRDLAQVYEQIPDPAQPVG